MFQKYKLKQQWRPIHFFTYGILDRFAGIMLGINNFVRIVQYLSSFARMSLALQNFACMGRFLSFARIGLGINIFFARMAMVFIVLDIFGWE